LAKHGVGIRAGVAPFRRPGGAGARNLATLAHGCARFLLSLAAAQSLCLRRKAGISMSGTPALPPPIDGVRRRTTAGWSSLS